MWIDSFVEFTPGERAGAVKNVTRSEEHLYDHFPGFLVMPATLIIEGMAQTAGILVGEARGFRENVILAKIKRASFDDFAVPGDQLRYDALLETIDEQAAFTTGTVLRNGKPMGKVDLIFSHVHQSASPIGLPDHNFVFTSDFLDLLATLRTRGSAGTTDDG